MSRRTFILFILFLLGLVLLPFHIVVSNKKRIKIVKVPGAAKDMCVSSTCTNREVILKSEILSECSKIEYIAVHNTTVFYNKTNVITKDNILIHDDPWLNKEVGDGDIILLLQKIYFD
jgi:hypothetical protein